MSLRLPISFRALQALDARCEVLPDADSCTPSVWASRYHLLAAWRLQHGRRWGEVAYEFQLDDAAAMLKPASATPMHFLTRPCGASRPPTSPGSPSPRCWSSSSREDGRAAGAGPAGLTQVPRTLPQRRRYVAPAAPLTAGGPFTAKEAVVLEDLGRPPG
jgi:hypothetical protein